MKLPSPFKRKSRTTDRLAKKRASGPAHPALHAGGPCVTLATQYGSKGDALGARLSERLGFRLYDSEILDAMAEQSKVPRDILSALDEDSTADFSYLMTSLLGSPYVVADDFARDLVRIIHQLAEEGNVVLVGRGAAFALHGPAVLNVRIIEPFPQRLERLQNTRQMSYTEAEITMAEIDSARAQFVEGHYKRDIEDPEAYDLVMNARFLDEDTILDLILQAFQAR